MCGIAGEFRFDGGDVDGDAISAMTAALAHRGPDDTAMHVCGPIGLGHRRLAILDLSPAGRQPFWSDDGTIGVVFNGEIYNFRDIVAELRTRGYAFHTECDTEALVNAVHCWGVEEAVRRFIGMFAFAVWNARERTVTLCRDRAGIKPLYYHVDGKRLLFASEMKGLLAHASFPRDLNREALAQYFALGYSAGEPTVLRDTYRVPAGHTLTVSPEGRITRRQYWSLDAVERGSFRGSFADAREQLEALCENAFTYRLVSDVPVAMFLSGGIDSTFVASVLRRKGADLLHLTIGFREAAYDESPKAAAVAKALGLRHVVRYLEAPDARAELERFVGIYDEPFGDTSGIPTSMVSAAAREHATVALSADGGDEQFCGYDSYPLYRRSEARLRPFPAPLRHLAAAAMRRAVPYEWLLSATMAGRRDESARPQVIARYEKLASVIDATTPAELLAVMNERAWSRRDAARLLGAPAAADLGLGRSPVEGGDAFVDAMLRTDYSVYMQDDILAKVDRASMAVSLECRDPLLDHRIAELAFSLPIDYLLGEGQQKRILRDILRPAIPAAILNAPKWGFSIPLYRWLRGPWRPYVEEYLSPSRVRATGVLDERVVTSEVQRFYRYGGRRAEKIFTMLNFQMWAERWLGL